jgi:hypothetical protein
LRSEQKPTAWCGLCGATRNGVAVEGGQGRKAEVGSAERRSAIDGWASWNRATSGLGVPVQRAAEVPTRRVRRTAHDIFRVRSWLAAARAAVPDGERGDGLGRDVVERLRRVGVHGGVVAFDRLRRDPDAEVVRRDAELGELADPLDAARVSAQPPSEIT